MGDLQTDQGESLELRYVPASEFARVVNANADPVSKAYARFFDSEAHRTCKACGHVMPRP